MFYPAPPSTLGRNIGKTLESVGDQPVTGERMEFQSRQDSPGELITSVQSQPESQKTYLKVSQ